MNRSARAAARHGGLVLVMLAASISLYLGYSSYATDPRGLWNGVAHDHHRHLVEAQRLASDLRSGELLSFLGDLERFRLYPPLHGLLAMTSLLANDMEHSAAVWPSLLGWWLTAIFAFLCTRRALPHWGNTAGLIAAFFILGSPAYRAFASEVMLESLGAALSLLCLYLYAIAVQSEAGRNGRRLGLALTLLLLCKYNYWLLVVVALALSHILANKESYQERLRRLWHASDWRARTRRELRSPFTLACVALLVAALGVALGGGGSVELWGVPISATKPYKLLYLAYLALFLRFAYWWWRAGRKRVGSLDPRLRGLLLWHALPAAVFLALPLRFGYLLRFVGPTNTQTPDASILDAIRLYAVAFVDAYHLEPAAALAAAGLALVALASANRLRPGGAAVGVFVTLSALLTLAHPNHQVRYLHSWIPAVWILVGIGVAVLLQSIRSPRVQGVAASAALLLAGSQAIAIGKSDAITMRAGERQGRSDLDLSDAYLPELAAAERIAFFMNLPMGEFVEWTFVERYGDRGRLEMMSNRVSRSRVENKRRFDRWLRDTQADLVVAIEVAADSDLYFEGAEHYAHNLDFLAEQTIFVRYREQRLHEHQTTVSFWRRAVPGASSPRSAPYTIRRDPRSREARHPRLPPSSRLLRRSGLESSLATHRPSES